MSLKIAFQVGPHEQELRLKIEIFDNDYNSADQLLGVTHLRSPLARNIPIAVAICASGLKLLLTGGDSYDWIILQLETIGGCRHPGYTPQNWWDWKWKGANYYAHHLA